MAAVFDYTTEVNRALDSGLSGNAAAEVMKLYMEMGNVLGIFVEGGTSDFDILDGLVGLLLETRDKARASKDYATADRIRDRLNEIGVILEDKGDKTTWRIA